MRFMAQYSGTAPPPVPLTRFITRAVSRTAALLLYSELFLTNFDISSALTIGDSSNNLTFLACTMCI